MANRDIRLGLGVDVDSQAARRGAQSIRAIDDGLDNVKDSAQIATKQMREFSDSAQEGFTAFGRDFAQPAKKSIQEINDELNLLRANMQDMPAFPSGGGGNIASSPMSDIPGGGIVGGSISTNFSELQTGIAGVGGSITVLGGEAGEAAGEILELTAQFPAFVNSLNKLRKEGGGVVDTLDSVADGIGVPGGGAGLAAALIGLAVAAKVATEASEILEKQVLEGIETREFAADLTQKSNEELRQTAIEQQAIIDENTARIAENKDEYEAASKVQKAQTATLITGVGAVVKLGQEVGVLPDVITPVIEAQEGYNSELDMAEKNLAATNEEMERRNVNLEEELDLSVENAAAATKLREFEREALAATEEENAARAESIKNRKSDIEEEIRALEENAETSEKARERIEQLNTEMETLDKQSEILSSSAVKSAEAQNAQAEATDEVTDSSKKAADQAKKFADEQRKLTGLEQKRATTAFNVLSKMAAAEQDVGNEIVKSRQEGMIEVAKLFDSQRMVDMQKEIDHQDKLSDIRENAKMDERDLLRADDFIQAFFGKEKEQEALAAEQRAFDKGEELRKRNNERVIAETLQDIDTRRKIEKEAAEADIEQQAIALQQELMAQDQQIREQQRITENAGDKTMDILSKQANERLQLTADVAQAELDMLGQVANMAQQAVQTVNSAVGSITNNNTTIAPHLNVMGGTNQGGFTNASMQQMQAQMMQMIALSKGVQV